MIREQIKPAILIFLVLTIITGIIYPLFVTGIAQMLFREKANGSLIYQDGKPVGSSLIGQSFDDPKYFWGRLSATSPVAYNASFFVRFESGAIKSGVKSGGRRTRQRC